MTATEKLNDAERDEWLARVRQYVEDVRREWQQMPGNRPHPSQVLLEFSDMEFLLSALDDARAAATDAKRWRHFADHMAGVGTNEDGDPGIGCNCGDMDDLRKSHPEIAARLDADGWLDDAASIEALVDYDMARSPVAVRETTDE